MKLRKLLSLILAAAMLLGCMCITAFADTTASGTADLDGDKNASKDIEQNYVFRQSGGTDYNDVTKVKLEWTITDIEATYESLKTWDPDKLQWTESKKNINAAGGGASFTITNYSSLTVFAKAEFTVEDSLKYTFDEPTYTNNECIVATPVVRGSAATYKEADFTAKAQNITVALKLNKDKFADLSAAASAAKYGVYTITISDGRTAQSEPAAPTVYYVTEYSVVLNENAEGKTAVRYGCSQTNDASSVKKWQDSVEFTGLKENTTYYFFAKYVNGDTYKEAISSGIEATTYPKYLTFVSDAPFTLGMSSDRHSASGLTVSTNAKDANASWTAFKYDGSAPSVAAVQDTDGKYYVYLRGNGMTSLTNDGNRTTLTLTNDSSDNKIDCIGNIMTLLDYNDSAKVKMGEEAFTSLFSDCSLLRSVDVVASKTLTRNCYAEMFYNCTSLTESPVLPAETMAEYCYREMFKGCTSLTKASKLPAETLAAYCYDRMFKECTSLTDAPALPAAAVAEGSYSSMFESCRSLTEAPALPAAELAAYCYSGMFSGCTALVNAPALPAEALAASCYNSMFSGCTSLVNAPALPAEALADSCYYSMFSGCIALVNAPALPAKELQYECYYGMFTDCQNLIEAPALPATKLESKCYYEMFLACSSLTEAPELPATELEGECYYAMFKECSSLIEAPALPATELAQSCYQEMFSGCYSLTKAPELPATELEPWCYESMFCDCYNLTSSPAIVVEKSAFGCLRYMFISCDGLRITDTKPDEGTEGVDYGIILIIKDVDNYNSFDVYETFSYITPAAGVTYYWYIW